MKQLFSILMFSLLFQFCTDAQPRNPVNKPKTSFLNNSAERNKALLAREENLLKKAAEKENALSFQRTSKGFLYAIKLSEFPESPLPVKGEKVRFEYQIETLDQKVIYSRSTLGVTEYSIDEEDFLPALREGLRLMREGDIVVFLFPSYLCYGYQGDGDKIKINQPLRFTIWRLPIS